MKGIIFTEFLKMVEERYGLETVDSIISATPLESKGIYTSVGTYNYSEMLSLLATLSSTTNTEINKLVYTYGLYFFSVIENSYKNIIETYGSSFDLISSIENHIHVHVRKIYPDAELPSFITREKKTNRLVIEYQSDRAMHSFAQGLMERTIEHYQENIRLEKSILVPDGTKVLFTLSKDA
ncbi:heme NO-binding domain-containing protein [Tenacibaculum sp. SG-28]|uniref:heme NO-binding domain-containing protein n=1 Tax=Tenacibaculum sp. SG-28 TaxID=754426 RepID=UPI000CF4DC6A|nr:heme NO-binding domain-containing protein [Tenacibaculum sp. SG-28]PQJ23137.1 hypothetical protein BSU00_02545 [Tenacibaculum sp. SG-28]